MRAGMLSTIARNCRRSIAAVLQHVSDLDVMLVRTIRRRSPEPSWSGAAQKRNHRFWPSKRRMRTSISLGTPEASTVCQSQSGGRCRRDGRQSSTPSRTLRPLTGRVFQPSLTEVHHRAIGSGEPDQRRHRVENRDGCRGCAIGRMHVVDHGRSSIPDMAACQHPAWLQIRIL